jgi:hypothetical protein
MNQSIMQSYVDYVTHMNKTIYDTHMSIVKRTNELMLEFVAQNPFKDPFGIQDIWVRNNTK